MGHPDLGLLRDDFAVDFLEAGELAPRGKENPTITAMKLR
jgi:hypothetical protein